LAEASAEMLVPPVAAVTVTAACTLDPRANQAANRTGKWRREQVGAYID
jgi:hypothetical protein